MGATEDLIIAILDACTEYDGPIERIRIGSYATDRKVYAELALHPRAQLTSTVFDQPGRDPYVIESVEVTVGTVCVEAQQSRPAAEHEIQSLETVAVRVHEATEGYRVCDLAETGEGGGVDGAV